jgi:integrase
MTTNFDSLTNYGENYIKSQVDLAIATQKKYSTIVNKLVEFEIQRDKKIVFKDVNLKLRSELIHYFSDVHRLSDNTIGRYLKFIKSLCLDAQRNGILVNRELNYFKGYTVKAIKTILTFAELDQIKSTNFSKDNHKTARDWLIIGCYTGQRVSDLLQMDSSTIQKSHNSEVIVIKQLKTGKLVQIPMHIEIKRVLLKRNGEFPPSFAENFESNKSLFNRYLKQLCKVAKLDTIERGSVYNNETKRNEEGEFEKYKLVSSHICRRSFATNFYGNSKYSTPLLMSITAHSTEKMFLEYIGKKQGDNDAQLSMF